MDSTRDFVKQSAIGRGWKVKKTFTTVPGNYVPMDWATVEAKVAAAMTQQKRPRKLFRLLSETQDEFVARAKAVWGDETCLQYRRSGGVVSACAAPPPGPPPGSISDHVSNCIFDIGLSKKARLECPRCGNTDWRRLVFQDDPRVITPDTPGYTTIMCIADTVQPPGGLPTQACGHKADLYDFMHQSERPLLHRDVKQWMDDKGVVDQSANANFFPSPYVANMPTYQQFKVILVCSGERFECCLTRPATPPNQAPPDPKRLECEAEAKYGAAIRNYLQSGGLGTLPREVKHIGGNGYAKFQSAVSTAPPRSLTEILIEQIKAIGQQMGQRDAEIFYDDCDDDDEPAKTESEKPEGTRDVEKFQKEQQDKLWKEMFG